GQLLAEASGLLQTDPGAQLRRNLPFCIAKSGGGSARLKALKEHCQLAGLWQEGGDTSPGSSGPLVGLDQGTMQSVAAARNEELLQVKERLDLFVRSTARSQHELGELLPDMKRIADTLAVLGLGQPRRVLQEQIERVEQLA